MALPLEVEHEATHPLTGLEAGRASDSNRPDPPILEGTVSCCGRCSVSRLTFTKLEYRGSIFLDMFGHSLLYPVIPSLLITVFGGSVAKASSFKGACMIVSRLFSLFCSPLMGNISDVVGRRPVVISMALAQGSVMLLMGLKPLAATIMTFYAVAGMFGAIIPTLFAAVTDLARLSDKSGPLTGQFGRAGVAISVAIASAPVLGGLIYRQGPSYPLILASIFLAVLAINLFLAAETLAPHQRKSKLDLSDVMPWRRVLAIFKDPEVALFAVPYVLQVIAETVHSSLVMYMMKRYHWDALRCGGFLSAVGFLVCFVQGSLKYVSPRFISDKQCALVGLLGHTAAVLILGFSSEGMQVIPAVFFMALAGLKMPGFLSIMTSHGSEDKRGVLQGSVGSLRALATLVGSPLYAFVLSWSTRRSTLRRYGHKILGLMFFMSAGFDALCLLAFVAAWYYQRTRDKPTAPASPQHSSSSEAKLEPEEVATMVTASV